jgi:mono/diheme cytochrome c family protein
MRRLVFPIGFSILVATMSWMRIAHADPIYADQGANWTAAARADFYTRDQGSRIISLTWLQALKRADGQPFLSDGLSRYGFLPNPDSTAGLPVGIHATGPKGFQIVGVTCSACHTRELEVAGKTYRVDGGPAFTDFQAFLSDLDHAVGDATVSDAAFASFAATVLQSPQPAATDVAELRQSVDAWYRRFHAFTTGTLPKAGWGLGRLDAVGIIFNRISGLDVGPPPDLLIVENMKIADAPVRYPFLWNSPVQDKADWAGFVINGNDLFALSRNTGQALAFANFEPKHVIGPFFNYLNNNSINFDGLGKIEELVRKMGPPQWPWPDRINEALRADGEKIFARECAQCHGINAVQHLFGTTWTTPVQNVGTDTHQFDELGWTAKTGVLKGAGIPGIAAPLKEEDFVVSMMFTAVTGSIAQHVLSGGFLGDRGSSFGGGFGAVPNPGAPLAPSSQGGSPTPDAQPPLPPALRDLAGAYRVPNSLAPPPTNLTIEKGTVLANTLERGAYEARVLQGIWAAAPYLHNGSVPTLAELLKPSAQRVAQFAVGTNYDVDNVGLAATQDGSSATRTVTDCNDLNSGNSRCGHEFGTTLSDPDKKALLEYLKTL